MGSGGREKNCFFQAVGRVNNMGQPMLACSPDPAHSSVRVCSKVINYCNNDYKKRAMFYLT